MRVWYLRGRARLLGWRSAGAGGAGWRCLVSAWLAVLAARCLPCAWAGAFAWLAGVGAGAVRRLAAPARAGPVCSAADAEPLARAPFTVQAKNAPAACYYNAAADFAAIYDTKFIDALHPAAQLRTTSAISAAVAYVNDEPFAVVMPIRAEPNAARAIKAFFTEAAEDNTKTGEADKLRAELAQAQEEAAALRGDLYRAANEIDELKNKLAELHETKTEQPAEQKPEPKTAAEIIAARWAEVDGLTATIKGATTAAPVVWLAGDTKPHEKEIEAAGGKWSGKKNAYYFRVA